MMGRSGARARMLRNSATPSSPLVASRWKFMSWITRCTRVPVNSWSPAPGVAATSTRPPCSVSSTSKAVRTASLSSMTRIVWPARLTRAALFGSSIMGRILALWRRLPVAAGPLHGAGRYRGTHGGGAARRLPGGQLSDSPQRQHAPDQVVEIQPRQRILERQPVANSKCQCAATDDPRARDHAVLDEEVAHDIAAARTD